MLTCRLEGAPQRVQKHKNTHFHARAHTHTPRQPREGISLSLQPPGSLPTPAPAYSTPVAQG